MSAVLAGRLAERAARELEQGRLRHHWLARRLAGAWAARARVERRVTLPRGAAVIGVGGPTLGGSYKTPLVVALARALGERGEPVAVVGHGYLARGHRAAGPRCVRPDDPVHAVGDDALWAARELSALAVPVYVGARRDETLSYAARARRTLIVDGLLQAVPERLALSVLSVDASAPWGAGDCPPCGDLRATVTALVGAADVIALVGADGVTPDAGRAAGTRPPGPQGDAGGAGPARHVVPLALDVAVASDGSRVPIAELRGLRVGVVLAIARPGRVLATLEALGVHPAEVRTFADHATPDAGRKGHARREGRRGQATVALWLTTPKCKTKLGERYEGAPVLALSPHLAVSPALVDRALCAAAG